MTGHARPGQDVALRAQLSSLQGLLVLAMLMTETSDEGRIVQLAASSVPSLGSCRLHGVHLLEGGWRAVAQAEGEAELLPDLEAQFAVLTSAGGPLAVIGEDWGWAFPLRSLEGHFGFLVVGADSEPPPSEQFLLRVLAQQTGIALANARSHARERASGADLRRTNAALAATVGILESNTAVHNRLTRAAGSGEGELGIVQAVHELTGHAVAAEDRYGNLRAWAGPGRPDPYPKGSPERREGLVRRFVLQGRAVRHEGRLVAVAGPREDPLGVLALIDPDGTAGEQEQVALEHGATVLAMELARVNSLAEAEMRLGRDLVEDLLAGIDGESTLARARALGYDLERPHRVLIVEARRRTTDARLFHDAVQRGVARLLVGSLLLARDSKVYVLADADRPWERLRAVVADDLRGGSCRIGVGGRAAHPGEIARSCREARFALRIQGITGAADGVTEFDELGVYRMLAGIEDPGDVERFVRGWLGALLDYDADRHSELVPTLSRYLESGGRYDATSSALGVHRSTLKYRLKRIGEISGHDLSDPDIHFNLHMATRAWHTLAALRGGSP